MIDMSNMMDVLIKDIIVYITTYLTDKIKLNLLSSNKYFHSLKNEIIYHDCIDIDKIHHLWYYDRFTKLVVHNIQHHIPKSVTHLTFGDNFNQNIKDCIPDSVTHLTFSDEFDQDIKDCIPKSVIHLHFGHSFNQDIRNCIPNSVIHLYFGYRFNQDIRDCIPNSVTHLHFGFCFDQDIRDC